MHLPIIPATHIVCVVGPVKKGKLSISIPLPHLVLSNIFVPDTHNCSISIPLFVVLPLPFPFFAAGIYQSTAALPFSISKLSCKGTAAAIQPCTNTILAIPFDTAVKLNIWAAGNMDQQEEQQDTWPFGNHLIFRFFLSLYL